jgi:hypothetical protein
LSCFMCDYRRYGLVNGFIDRLNTPLGTTSNYSTIANLQTLQITTPPAKLFSSLLFLQQTSLVTASNSGNSSTFRTQVLLSQPPVQELLSTDSSTNWVPGWRSVHINLLVFYSQADFKLTAHYYLGQSQSRIATNGPVNQ